VIVFAFRFIDLIFNNILQPLGGGLDGALVDISGNPAPAEFLGDDSGSAGADETIQNQIARIGRSLNYTFQ